MVLCLFHLVFVAGSVFDTIKNWTLGSTAAMTEVMAKFLH